MTTDPDPTLEILKVVDAADLEYATASGWQLKRVLSEGAVEYAATSSAHPNAGGTDAETGQYNQDTIPTIISHGLTVHRYLLCKSADSLVAELTERLASRDGDVASADSLLEVAVQDLAVMTEAKELKAGGWAAEQKRVAALELDLREIRAEIREAGNLRDRAEAMVDVVRLEIGTVTMRRILEEADEPDDGKSLADILGEVPT